MARCRHGVGFHGSGWWGWSGRSVVRGQPGEAVRLSSRVIASTPALAQGARSDMCKTVCLAVRAIVAGIVNRRWRSRFGSQRRASWLVRASIPIQASRSVASVTMAHQIWLAA